MSASKQEDMHSKAFFVGRSRSADGCGGAAKRSRLRCGRDIASVICSQLVYEHFNSSSAPSLHAFLQTAMFARSASRQVWGPGRPEFCFTVATLTTFSHQLHRSTPFNYVDARLSRHMFWLTSERVECISYCHTLLFLLLHTIYCMYIRVIRCRRPITGASGVGPRRPHRRPNERNRRVDTRGADGGRANGNREWFARGE